MHPSCVIKRTLREVHSLRSCARRQRTRKMAAVSLQEEELLAESVRIFPVLYDKSEKGYKEKDVVSNAWGKVAEKLDFIENGSHFV